MAAEHEFSLVLDGVSDLDRTVVDALFEAGCDDATIMMQGGQVLMGFIRSAPTLRDAILTAITDIQRAGIGARVVRIDDVSPDPSSAESAAREVGTINVVLQLSAAIEMDPTLRPVVVELLGSDR